MTDGLLKMLYGLKDGSATYEEVKHAVREHEFVPLEDHREWDYVRTEGSFTDTVRRAFYLRLITREQMNELREIAYGKED